MDKQKVSVSLSLHWWNILIKILEWAMQFGNSARFRYFELSNVIELYESIYYQVYGESIKVAKE